MGHSHKVEIWLSCGEWCILYTWHENGLRSLHYVILSLNYSMLMKVDDDGYHSYQCQLGSMKLK